MAKFKFIGEFEDGLVTYRINAAIVGGDADLIMAEVKLPSNNLWQEINFDSLPEHVKHRALVEIRKRINEDKV
jgi:hypothetical protein